MEAIWEDACVFYAGEATHVEEEGERVGGEGGGRREEVGGQLGTGHLTDFAFDIWESRRCVAREWADVAI